jgi:hypothetical protein
MFNYTIAAIIITAAITLIKSPKLKTKSFILKDWSLVILAIAGTAIAFFSELSKYRDEQDRKLSEKYNQDVGTLSPTKSYNSPLMWDVGDHIHVFDDGMFDISKAQDSYQIFKTLVFKAWIENNQVYINTDVVDSTGALIARIIKNEWAINPSKRWDKNFDDNGLEVIDNGGNVVFQIDIIQNKIRLQGMFYNMRGDATIISDMPLGPTRRKTVTQTWMNEGYPFPLSPQIMLKDIKPNFKYPSKLNKGERVLPLKG